MKKRIINIIATLMICVLFCTGIKVVQTALVYGVQKVDNTISSVEGFYATEKNSLDVIFLGSSQMFCSVNSGQLQKDHGIEAYSFGASAQPLPITSYYLQEALKTQSPKIVMVESSWLFDTAENISDEKTLAWSYAFTPATLEKWKSLYAVTGNDAKLSMEYMFPILTFHSRWNSFEMEDLMYAFSSKVNPDAGYIRRDNVMTLEIQYLGKDEGTVSEIPQSNIDAVIQMKNICDEKDIKLVFFKTPVSGWCRAESVAAKELFKEHGIEYFEMNDYLEEINIDPETDFSDESHLNYNGARKTTDYLAVYLKKYIDNVI